MGTLTYIRENLFETDRHVIAHGVNCRGGFGSGVAGQIAKRFPDVKRAYIRKHEKEGWSLGDIQIVQTANKKLIVNMATQDSYGKTGIHVDYKAVSDCLDRVLLFCEQEGSGLAIPKIGCGLGGGDWAVVEGIIRDCLSRRQVEVDVHSLE